MWFVFFYLLLLKKNYITFKKNFNKNKNAVLNYNLFELNFFLWSLKTVSSLILKKIKNFFFFDFKSFKYQNLPKNNQIRIKRLRFLELKFFFHKSFFFKNKFFFFINFIFLTFYYTSLNFKNKKNVNFNFKLIGLKSLWSIFKFWLLAFFFFFFYYYYLTFIKTLPLSKLLFEWFVLVMFLYLLLSGFVFFFKKYQYSKYTSVIQRFWKRSYILFWLIESGIFVVFFYLTININEETIFTYDPFKLNKTHLFSWKIFILKTIFISFLFFFSYLIVLNLKWSVFSKNILFVLVITLCLFFVLWVEFYQFIHIITSYLEIYWTIDEEDNFFFLETDNVKHKTVNNYVTLCLLAKFWHTIFIVAFWFFFLLRINETKQIKYGLLAANNQNFIILYMMSWLYMYPWLKFFFKPFFESSYYWFFINKDLSFLNLFFFFFKEWYLSIFFFFFNQKLFFFFNYTFFYINENSIFFESSSFSKHFLKDKIIKDLLIA